MSFGSALPINNLVNSEWVLRSDAVTDDVLVGEFIKSFRDDYTEVEHNRGMESIRKEVCCRQNELYVSDANTASVRGTRQDLLSQTGAEW